MEKLLHKPTQCDRVLKILQEGSWVDGMTFLQLDSPITQYHARIFELQEIGHDIIGEFVPGKNWKRYKLIKPEEQQTLLWFHYMMKRR